MNPLLDNTDEEDQRVQHHGGDREITLGTTTILLIFFALVVQDAVVFAFGYSMNKHTATAAVVVAPPTSGSFTAFKPAPGNPLGSGSAAAAKSDATDATPVPYTPPVSTKTVPLNDAGERPEAPAPVVRQPPPAASAASSTSAAVPGAGPQLVVQIAAVSHLEDAQMIATTLQRRGYSVNVMTEPDKLVHVQVGPFNSRKDAEAMRARLLADGFNAYIK